MSLKKRINLNLLNQKLFSIFILIFFCILIYVIFHSYNLSNKWINYFEYHNADPENKCNESEINSFLKSTELKKINRFNISKRLNLNYYFFYQKDVVYIHLKNRINSNFFKIYSTHKAQLNTIYKKKFNLDIKFDDFVAPLSTKTCTFYKDSVPIYMTEIYDFFPESNTLGLAFRLPGDFNSDIERFYYYE